MQLIRDDSEAHKDFACPPSVHSSSLLRSPASITGQKPAICFATCNNSVSKAGSIPVKATICHHFSRISSYIHHPTFMPSLQKTKCPSPAVHPSPTMNIPHPPSEFDKVLNRLQKLALPSHSCSSLTSPSTSVLSPSSDSPKARYTLGAPFSMSHPHPFKQPDEDDVPTIIDTFAPRPLAYDLSPISSASSDFDSLSSHSSFPRAPFNAFVATRSRVVRVCGVNHPRIQHLLTSTTR